jgi:uncharacterized protein (TIGR02300 family)
MRRDFKGHIRTGAVAKAELGTKRVCPVTGRKFYDLGRDPIVSPYTGISYPRAQFEAPVKGAAPKIAQAATDEEVEPETEEAELVSLEEADAEEASTGAKATPAADADVEDVDVEDEGGEADDTFLEEEEDEGTDVADLIDGEIEEDEEP